MVTAAVLMLLAPFAEIVREGLLNSRLAVLRM